MNSSAPGVVPLRGKTTIELHDSLPKLKDWSTYLKDFALNENKSIQLSEKSKISGSKKHWICTDPECPWIVTLSYRSQPRTTKSSKLSHIPPKSWFVSSLSLDHSDTCTSTGSCSVRQIKETKGFKAALVEGLSTAKKRVVESIRAVDGVDVEHMQSKVYQAIAQAKAARRKKALDVYETLASWMKRFSERNPGSRVCCQLDTRGRFFRAFMSIGSIVEQQHLLIPLYDVDGTHMKNPDYNGICVLLDGNMENVPVAIGLIHKETTDNFSWFFANCFAAGIRLGGVAVFSDRGKQRNAQVLLESIGLKMHVKFCSLHIAFNVADRFRLKEADKERARGLVRKLQKASSRVQYESVLLEIRNAWATRQFSADRT